MKTDTRNPVPSLPDVQLRFFYGILTLWESGVEDKVKKNFTTKEIKSFLARKDSNGNPVLVIDTEKRRKGKLALSELRYINTKSNKGLSLLYHLRNAFAHNRIVLDLNSRILHIRNEYNGAVKMEGRIAFDVLKEFVETLQGKHDFPVKSHKTKKKIKK